MAAAPLLTVVCARRRHVMLRVLPVAEGGMVIEAPLYVAGLDRATWTPRRVALRRGGHAGHRYGCRCGFSGLLMDRQLAEAVEAGVTRWIVG